MLCIIAYIEKVSWFCAGGAQPPFAGAVVPVSLHKVHSDDVFPCGTVVFQMYRQVFVCFLLGKEKYLVCCACVLQGCGADSVFFCICKGNVIKFIVELVAYFRSFPGDVICGFGVVLGAKQRFCAAQQKLVIFFCKNVLGYVLKAFVRYTVFVSIIAAKNKSVRVRDSYGSFFGCGFALCLRRL